MPSMSRVPFSGRSWFGALGPAVRRMNHSSACLVFADGSIRVEAHETVTPDGKSSSSRGPRTDPGKVAVKLRAAPCTSADLRTIDAASRASVEKGSTGASHPGPTPHHQRFVFPFVGGSEGLWEVTAAGEGVRSLRQGDLAVPAVPGIEPGTGMWVSEAILDESLLVKVPQDEGVEPNLAAHASASVATALRILEDFCPKALEAGDRVVLTGASSAVAQILLQLAAARGLESVCLVSDEEERELANGLGAWKATLLKEFKAMRMDNACLVADGEGGVLGFTAARSLGHRGYYVSYADVSGGGISLPVAGQIFRDTRCRGFSVQRWAWGRPLEETTALVSRSLEAAQGMTLEGVREFHISDAIDAVAAAREAAGPVLLRG